MMLSLGRAAACAHLSRHIVRAAIGRGHLRAGRDAWDGSYQITPTDLHTWLAWRATERARRLSWALVRVVEGEKALAAVARVYQLSPGDLTAPGQGSAVRVEARHVLWWVLDASATLRAHAGLPAIGPYTLIEMSHLCGRDDHTTISESLHLRVQESTPAIQDAYAQACVAVVAAWHDLLPPSVTRSN